jgi:hypothetical protein
MGRLRPRRRPIRSFFERRYTGDPATFVDALAEFAEEIRFTATERSPARSGRR